MAAIEEERNAIILCMPNAKECLCRRLHHFTTDVDSAGKDVEELVKLKNDQLYI